MRTPCLPGSSCSSTYSDGVENPAELMELSFGESGCNIAKMSYSIPGVFHSVLSVLLFTQTLFPDGGMCRLLVGTGRVTAACLSQAQASTQLLGHAPSGTQTQMPAMLNSLEPSAWWIGPEKTARESEEISQYLTNHQEDGERQRVWWKSRTFLLSVMLNLSHLSRRKKK